MNTLKGEALLTLEDGSSFTLVLDFDALIDAESVYGKPLSKLMADASAGFIGAVRALLLGALRRHHPDLTAADASGMLQTDFDAVGAAMQAATEAAFPSAEGKEPGKARQAGSSSGTSGAPRGSTPTASGGRPRAASR